MKNGLWWLASYPKSGNTWLRAFLCNLGRTEPASINSLNTGGLASSKEWFEDVLGIDSSTLAPERRDELRSVLYRWTHQHAREPIYGKAHDACVRLAGGADLFPCDAMQGVVYLIRNPLDVAVSLSFHMGCAIDESIRRMASENHTLAGRSDAGQEQFPQRLASWSQHVRSWVDAPGHNTVVVRYEDLFSRPVETFRRISAFLDLSISEDELQRTIRYSAFDVLRAQEDRDGFVEASRHAPRFFRNGMPGQWKTVLTPDQVARTVKHHGEQMRRFGYFDEGTV